MCRLVLLSKETLAESGVVEFYLTLSRFDLFKLFKAPVNATTENCKQQNSCEVQTSIDGKRLINRQCAGWNWLHCDR